MGVQSIQAPVANFAADTLAMTMLSSEIRTTDLSPVGLGSKYYHCFLDSGHFAGTIDVNFVRLRQSNAGCSSDYSSTKTEVTGGDYCCSDWSGMSQKSRLEG